MREESQTILQEAADTFKGIGLELIKAFVFGDFHQNSPEWLETIANN